MPDEFASVRSTLAVFEPCEAWRHLKDIGMNSFLTNSIVIDKTTHVDGGMFVQTAEGNILARLDGFLIVPIEKVPNLTEFLRSVGVNTDPTAIPV